MTVENVETRVEIFPDDLEQTDNFLDRAFVHLRDLKTYSDYMDDVINVKVEAMEVDKDLVSWETKIDNAEFDWKQITIYDKTNHSINFELIEGDFDMMKGKWQVLEEESKFFFRLDIQYDIGLPVIEDVLGPVLKGKLQVNSLNMLSELKKRIEE